MAVFMHLFCQNQWLIFSVITSICLLHWTTNLQTSVKYSVPELLLWAGLICDVWLIVASFTFYLSPPPPPPLCKNVHVDTQCRGMIEMRLLQVVPHCKGYELTKLFAGLPQEMMIS